MECIDFFKRFLTSPGTIGSITPSSSFLAERMVKASEVCACRKIIELGAGTGVFTRHLVRFKKPACELYIFEKDMVLASGLQKKFPTVKLYSEASEIKSLHKSGEIGQVDLIISGLPFAVLPASLRREILEGVFEVLRPGGKFVTFQYSLHLLKELEKNYALVDLEFVLLNIPPAFIYRCTKGGEAMMLN